MGVTGGQTPQKASRLPPILSKEVAEEPNVCVVADALQIPYSRNFFADF